MIILHVAQISIAQSSGMGRVAWHWREELERRGHRFIHIGDKPLGRETHPALYPYIARKAARAIKPAPDLVLAHEPASGVFAAGNLPLVAFSHGIERRGWEIAKRHQAESGERIRFRSRLLFPIWRLWPADFGLKRARGVLVLNREDYDYCVTRYGRTAESVFLFRNGTNPAVRMQVPDAANPSVLFVGTWIARKGIRTLVAAAKILHAGGVTPRWVLGGTGLPPEDVLRDWPESLRQYVDVLPRFSPEEEMALLNSATVFVLPSFFEGQPLALLQAMAVGLPVVATDCCGQRDLIKDGESGFLVSPGDAQVLADRLRSCLTQADLRGRLGSAARQTVSGRTWQSAAGEVADFLEKIRERAPG